MKEWGWGRGGIVSREGRVERDKGGMGGREGLAWT